jgi:hypothetical protein
MSGLPYQQIRVQKLFFSALWSAKALLNLTTNETTTQIITGHCS